MPADDVKRRSQEQLEAIGAELLSEQTRADVRATVQRLHAKLAEVKAASAKAADADRAAMNHYLGNSQSARLKAEELHTVADSITDEHARQSVRHLAQSYERLAERTERHEQALVQHQKAKVR